MTTERMARSFSFEASTDWHRLPGGMTLHECPGVAVAPDDTVYVLTRNVENPVIVFTREGDEFRHRWATELMFAPRDDGEEPRHVDSIWPIWNVLDMTPGGRGSGSDFPLLHYE